MFIIHCKRNRRAEKNAGESLETGCFRALATRENGKGGVRLKMTLLYDSAITITYALMFSDVVEIRI